MNTQRAGGRDHRMAAISGISRRAALGWSLAGAASLTSTSVWAGLAEHEPLNRYPRMVHDFFLDQLKRSEQRRRARFEHLESSSDAQAYVADVQRRIRRCFGRNPPRTPLNTRVTGVVERDAYRIEKVIFDSRPGFPVTANLYLPTRLERPCPGVVGTCGHSANGKAAEAYQSFAQGLARLGYACLIYDPIGQGERLQYVNDEGTSTVGSGVQEHLYAGNQQLLVGEFFGSWRAWDGSRALDYLLTRKEVDPRHLGVTGNSGGGTMTTWLCGLEPRWTMAAPSCFVTTFRRNLENELPADIEQCPPRALALGLDHADFIAAMAPKPVILLAKEKDFFDVRGTEEAYAQLKRLYGLLDAEDNIGLFVGPSYHGYSQENREAMYGWFNRITGASMSETEPEITLEEDSTLWCAPDGQVANLEATRTVFHFTRERAGELERTRGAVSGEMLKSRIREVLALPDAVPSAPEYRIWRYLGSRGYPTRAIGYAVETEPPAQAIVYRLTDQAWYSRPPQGPEHAVLYVAHRSSDQELREQAWLRDLIAAQQDTAVYTCDVRGIGESEPGTCAPNSFESSYGCDYFYAAHGLMLARPYLGQKTWDVLRVLDWLHSLGHNQVHLVAMGWGALAGCLAAVLSPRVNQVTLKHPLVSFTGVAKSERYKWPLAQLPPNILRHFDLPDCYAELASRSLVLDEPWAAEAG